MSDTVLTLHDQNNENHLISRGSFSDRVYSIKFKEGEFYLPDDELLVRRKGNVHWVRANQVGDGMQLICVYRREKFQLDQLLKNQTFIPEDMLQGMQIYREYDEEKDETTIYLYKHAKDTKEIQYINNVLETYELAAQVKQQGHFVVMHIQGNDLPIINAVGSSSSFGQHLSFFLGLLLAYPSWGSIIEQTKDFTTRKTTIPLVGSIASYEQRIGEMIYEFQKKGIFLTKSVQQENLWSVLQVTVTDREILSLLRQLLGKEQEHLPSREFFFDTTLKNAVSTVKRDIDLRHSVLKLITK